MSSDPEISEVQEVKSMRQYAPWPTELEALIARLQYRDWKVWLEDQERDSAATHGAPGGGLTLVIRTRTANSYHFGTCGECGSIRTDYKVHHFFIVPAATFDRAAWQRWLFDRFVDVETHEAMEFFTLNEDGAWTRPFAPVHGPGHNPYTITQLTSDEARRTSFMGVVKESDS